MVTQRYIYADKVGAGPEHPSKRWGLFSKELTTEEAAARYHLDSGDTSEWFGVVRLSDGAERPDAYLEASPGGRAFRLAKLDVFGSIDASYTWRAADPSDDAAHRSRDDSVFLRSIIWYVYPEGEQFFGRHKAIGNVQMEFRPDGYAKEERITRGGRGEPSPVETREFRDVDMTANWARIPEFGDWDDLFHPEGEEDAGAA